MVKMVQLMDYLVHDLNGHSSEYVQVPIRDKNMQSKAYYPVASMDNRLFYSLIYRPRRIMDLPVWIIPYDEKMLGSSVFWT